MEKGVENLEFRGMSMYAAFLGHQPHISISELAAVVPGFTLVDNSNKKVALFESSQVLPPSLLEHLGGTVLLAEQVGKKGIGLNDIPDLVVKETEKVRGKTTFSLRAAGLPPATVRTLYKNTKLTFKKRNRSVRYIGSDKKPAVAVLLHDSGVLDGKKGCEIVLVNTEKGLWVGRTFAAQDVNAYTKRDMDKPARDTVVGLLPPKLAQIMLNHGLWLLESQKKPKAAKKWKLPTYTVFDPFCGTGVIPLECLNRQWPVLASDISQKAVNQCTKNLDWIRKEAGIAKKDVPSTVWKHDATKPFDLKKPLPQVIVTETSLGTPMVKQPTQKDAAREKSANETLQANFLRNAAATLAGVPIVCTWPVWRLKNGPLFLEKIWDVIEELPYEVVQPISLEDHDRPTLFYRRADHYVGREIVLLRPSASK